jgi:PGF-CTERM protein/uncharacterized repeat protein (TIGR01451 family)
MNAKIIAFGLFIVLVLSVGMASALSNSGGGDWGYYREVTIKENSGTALSDYQVLVVLNPSNFPDNAKYDGSDIRFAEDGKEFSYWIENYDVGAKTAKIWVKVPRIPANGEAKIKMHYGNDKAGTVSDGDATFELFDDFSGYSVDQSKWYLEGTPSISNGILHLDRVGGADESIKSKVKYGDNYAMRTKALFYDVSNKQAAFIGFIDIAAPHAAVQTYLPYYKAGDVVGGHTNDKKVNIMDPLGEYTNRFYAYEVRRINGGASYYVEGSPEIRQPASIGVDLPIKAMAEITDGAKVDLDWIFVRKYTSSEPTLTLSAEYPVVHTVLTLTKTASPHSIKQEQKTAVKITVENTGTTTIKDIEVVDTPPADFDFVSGDTSAKYGILKPGESRTFQYTLRSGDTGKFDLGQATVTYADEEGNYHTVESNSPMVEVMAPLEKPEIPTGEEGEEKGIPGFEVAFAIAGLLAVVYLLRRRK